MRETRTLKWPPHSVIGKKETSPWTLNGGSDLACTSVHLLESVPQNPGVEKLCALALSKNSFEMCVQEEKCVRTCR